VSLAALFVRGLVIGCAIAAPVGILCIRRTLDHGRLLYRGARSSGDDD
jgi:hypothetical protein